MEGKADSWLRKALTRLAEHYGEPPGPPASDAFELIVYENVAYLAPDDRRRAAFEQLRKTVGLRPESLARAPGADQPDAERLHAAAPARPPTARSASTSAYRPS